MRSLSYAKKGIMLVCIIYMVCIMLIHPIQCITSAKDAITTCGEIVIPTLFPFIFCGNLFISLGAARYASRAFTRVMHPLFGVSGAGAIAVVLGFVSGYPVGAISAASLYLSGECDKTEAERLIAFCNNSGPMFIIGAIGVGILKNQDIGIFLYIVHILSALLCGIIFKGYGKREKKMYLPHAKGKEKIKTTAPDIGTAVVKSVNSILIICGFIIIFAVVKQALPNNEALKYLYPLLEITGGIKEFVISYSGELTLPLISFFLAFSGISVLAQVYAVTSSSGLSVVPYILGKLVQACIAALITTIAIKLTPTDIQVFSRFASETKFAISSTDLFKISIIILGYSVILFFVLYIITKLTDIMKNKARHQTK